MKKKNIFFSILCLLSLLFFTGCASQYDTSNLKKSPDYSQKKVFVLPVVQSEENITKESLADITNGAKEIIGWKGFKVTELQSEADLLFELKLKDWGSRRIYILKNGYNVDIEMAVLDPETKEAIWTAKESKLIPFKTNNNDKKWSSMEQHASDDWLVSSLITSGPPNIITGAMDLIAGTVSVVRLASDVINHSGLKGEKTELSDALLTNCTIDLIKKNVFSAFIEI